MSSRNVVDLRKKRAGGSAKFLPLPLPAGRQDFRRKRAREPLRTRRRKARLLIVGVIALLLLILFGTISYVAHLARFRIQTISVSGHVHVPAEKVQEDALRFLRHDSFEFFPADNIFLYHPIQLARTIVADFPRIKEASVSRGALMSTTVYIDVIEREPFAKWCRYGSIETSASSTPASNCYVMDDGGFIFAPLDLRESLVNPVVFLGGVASTTSGESPIGKLFAPSRLPWILALLVDLKEHNLTPHQASVEGEDDLFVTLERGLPAQAAFYIKTSFGTSAEDLTKNLMLILGSDALKGKEDQLEYIDLRFGNKVYYKLTGEEEAQ